MPKTVGSTQNAEKKQQEFLAGKAIDVQKKEEANREKEHCSSTRQKDDFSILQNISGY